MYENLLNSPVALRRKITDDLLKGGTTITQGGSPFTHLLESSIMTVTSAVNSIEQVNKKRTISLADSLEDAYYHLHDDKIKDAFSTPGSAQFQLLFSYDELKGKAVRVEGTTYSKLVIPANTAYMANDREYTLLRPINILFQDNGNLRVLYDATIDTPIQPLESNQVPWLTSIINGTKVLILEVHLLQVKMRSFSEKIELNRTFKTEISLRDRFHHCRVFDTVSGREFTVTFNEELIDPLSPTAIVRYFGDKLSIVIPSYYNTERMISRNVKIEVYVTSGEINDPIDKLQLGQISYQFGDKLANSNDTVYSTPLINVSMHAATAITRASGGKNGQSVGELVSHVKYGGVNDYITFDQLDHGYSTNDFNVTLIEESLTGRKFLASKELPTDTNSSFSTGIACAIDQVKLTLGELANSSSVIDNFNSITILPGTLFKYVNGIPVLLNDQELPSNLAEGAVELANIINSNSYAYVPLHYVIDSRDDILTMEPYYLEDPKLISRNFVGENINLDVNIRTLDVKVESTDYGYELNITSVANETLSKVPETARLIVKFRPHQENKDASLLATLSHVEGKYLYWKVRLESNFEVLREHKLNISNFIVNDDTPDDYHIDLNPEFKLIYAVARKPPIGHEETPIDQELPLAYIGSKHLGLTHETIKLHLGRHMAKLWKNSRTLPGPWDWMRYDADIPLRHDSTEYVYENGRLVLEEVDGIQLPKVKWRKGDIATDEYGTVYLHRKGDVMRGDDGEPILKSPDRSTENLLTLLLVDGVYRYANSSIDMTYAKSVPKLIIDIIDTQISNVDKSLGENTSISYSPKKTLGEIPVSVDSGARVSLPTNLSFEVDVYLTGEAKADTSLVNEIRSNIPTIIHGGLKDRTVSLTNLETLITKQYEGDILSTNIKIRGHEDITLFTPINTGDSPSIKRRLLPLRDNQLVVDNDILITPIAHSTLIEQ
tara:strand:+ start:104255 stop:107104 length:2850 start_codon:yes stop_codon:yes gene_type:complete